MFVAVWQLLTIFALCGTILVWIRRDMLGMRSEDAPPFSASQCRQQHPLQTILLYIIKAMLATVSHFELTSSHVP
jgi:hypothetical protein